MNRLILIAALTLPFTPSHLIAAQETPHTQSRGPESAATSVPITIKKQTGKITVHAGSELFTVYDHATWSKPILYPVFGPAQLPMTRHWPMKKVRGEADDHPHHKSVWVGHEINGVDFWAETGGSIKHQSITSIDKEKSRFTASSLWIRKDDAPVCTLETAYTLAATESSRHIDVTLVFHASHGDLQFEDSKEGTFAVRTHPNLRLEPDASRGVQRVFGQAVNSNRTRGKKIWGESAKWVHYAGLIDDKLVGLAMFDDPANLRHPTTWHAREYGLVAANPFGLHHFQKRPKGTGEYLVKQGDTLKLRYGLLFHLGKLDPDQLDEQFDLFVARGVEK